MKSNKNTWKVQEKNRSAEFASENHIKDPKKMFPEDIPIL